MTMNASRALSRSYRTQLVISTLVLVILSCQSPDEQPPIISGHDAATIPRQIRVAGERGTTAITVFPLTDAPRNPDGEALLSSGREGIQLPGPPVSSDDIPDISRLFVLDNARFQRAEVEDVTGSPEEGYEVSFNPLLSYRVAIEDWQDELRLIEVVLLIENRSLLPNFVFATEPEGDGRLQITIAAVIDGAIVRRTPRFSIEVREPTKIAWGTKVSWEFRRKVSEVAIGLDTSADYLMAVMNFETAGTFDPSIRSTKSGAVGLIQFLPQTAKGLGTAPELLQALEAVEQLDYVEKYFLPYEGRLDTLEDVYMAVLWPKAIGQPKDYVLFRKPAIEYSQNSGLDSNSDGQVTKAEASEKVRRSLDLGLRPENQG
jgi:hypothetical protein